MGTALYIMVLTYYKRIRQAEIYKVNVFITQMHYHSKQLPSDLKVKIYHILNFIMNIFSNFTSKTQEWSSFIQTPSSNIGGIRKYSPYPSRCRGGGRPKKLVWQALVNLLNIGMADYGK